MAELTAQPFGCFLYADPCWRAVPTVGARSEPLNEACQRLISAAAPLLAPVQSTMHVLPPGSTRSASFDPSAGAKGSGAGGKGLGAGKQGVVSVQGRVGASNAPLLGLDFGVAGHEQAEDQVSGLRKYVREKGSIVGM